MPFSFTARFMRLILALERRLTIMFVRLVPVTAAVKLGYALWRIRHRRLALQLLQKAILAQRKEAVSPVVFPTTPVPRQDVLVSVIIPTYNRATSLARCLESLSRQTLDKKKFEIVVVNNGCTDRTSEVCSVYANRFPNFLMTTEQTPGLLAGRHTGWRAASADLLTFCDDDIEALPPWLESIVTIGHADPTVSLLGGNNLPAFESPPPGWMDGLWTSLNGVRWNEYYSLIEGITRPMEPPIPTLVFGCNFTIRRQALVSTGGFEPDCMGSMLFQGGGESAIIEDIIANGGRVFVHPDVSVIHHMPNARLCFDYMYRRGIYTGIYSTYCSLRKDDRQLHSPSPYDGTNPALERFHEGVQLAVNTYCEAAFKSPALREWISRVTYIDNEAPPIQALQDCEILAARLGW